MQEDCPSLNGRTMTAQQEDIVYFEAVVRGESSMFDEAGASGQSLAELQAPRSKRIAAARALEARGFKVYHIGDYSLSCSGTRENWERTFQTRLEKRYFRPGAGLPTVDERAVLSHVAGVPFVIPPDLDGLIERAYPQLPPELFVAPIPPRVQYNHLRVPDDVAVVLRSSLLHRRGITGNGVFVVTVDTGLYAHPYHAWHEYNCGAVLAPDAQDVDLDQIGHGTAQSANLLACAPGARLAVVKIGSNMTLAFKTAVDLGPQVISLSWGFDLAGQVALPNYLRPLEAAVADAVSRGIVVICSAGNGQVSFPAMMPEVIAVGGVFATPDQNLRSFRFAASDYASSFDSNIYPGRHVPDVCGLVGMAPRAIFLMLPVPPASAMDTGFATGGYYPRGDETSSTDGWAVSSGTSSAAPQVAGVCAQLLQTSPALKPDVIKSVLRASARAVTVGKSALGQAASLGTGGATGCGLVDAYGAGRLVLHLAT
jgi:hypothetical protein